ncbi:MAG: hypothetical protein WD696_17750 [Bryobacteraceae bacterium]
MRLPAILLLASSAFAQIPSEDARNTNPPNTDTHFKMPEYKTLAEWEQRRTHLRKQILSASGLTPMPEKTPLTPRIFGRIEHKDYSIEKVLLQTLPNYFLGGNLYRPIGRSGKLPAVVSPHGHWTYGRIEHQPLGSIPARAINLARQGYVVFAYDMVGYNDTVQTPHAFGGPREQLWSFGPLGLQLWNSIRAVDFLESLPEVDAKRIGATGASGGGTQTFLLTAVDDRVAFSAPVNMISAIMQGGSPCENAPNLRVRAFNVEIGAMMAPRPMLMVSATGDWTRNTPREEFPAIRSIYALYDRAAYVEEKQIDAPHNYNQASREAVYGFFGRRVLEARDVSQFTEKPVRVEKLQDMLALHGRPLPEGALSFEALVEQWISHAKRQNDATSGVEEFRERLRYALLAEWPDSVSIEQTGERLLLGRPGRGDRVSGFWAKAAGPATLIVNGEGAEAARKTDAFRTLASARKNVMTIDAFQTGAARGPRDRSPRHYLTFNQTEDANRVQDILTALKALEQSGASELRLVGQGRAAVWCLFAAAVAGKRVTLEADLKDFKGEDADFIDRFFVPGIQRAGGLRAARIVTGLK